MQREKVTSQELAEKTGISKRTIDEYRSKRKEPSFTNGIKLADALKVDPHDLIEEEEENMLETTSKFEIGMGYEIPNKRGIGITLWSNYIPNPTFH